MFGRCDGRKEGGATCTMGNGRTVTDENEREWVRVFRERREESNNF